MRTSRRRGRRRVARSRRRSRLRRPRTNCWPRPPSRWRRIPALRMKILDIKKSYEQMIDTITKDEVLEAGFSEAAKQKAQSIVQSFEQFIELHKDEITALAGALQPPLPAAAHLQADQGAGRGAQPPARRIARHHARGAVARLRNARPLQGARLRRTRC